MHAHTSLLMCSSFFNYGVAHVSAAAAVAAHCSLLTAQPARRTRSEGGGGVCVLMSHFTYRSTSSASSSASARLQNRQLLDTVLGPLVLNDSYLEHAESVRPASVGICPTRVSPKTADCGGCTLRDCSGTTSDWCQSQSPADLQRILGSE